jgi:ribosomal protein L40E
MNDTTGAATIDLKWFGTLSPKQLLGLIAAFVLALMLTLFGFSVSCMCFGMLIIAVILYMLPRTLGVDNIKLMVLVGALFTVSATLIGGYIVAPGYVEANHGDPADNDFFTNVEFTYTSSGIDVTATLREDIGTHEVYLKSGAIRGIAFGFFYADFENIPLTATGTTVSGSIPLDRDRLYAGGLMITETRTVDGVSEEVIKEDSKTSWTFFTEAFDGDINQLSIFGCFIATIYITLAFFMIMVLSKIMRGRMEKTRVKMEKDGRLYPKGYGRCAQCGTVVLPGEVNCRKCGAYIDRPEEMKPDKKDFFECSECGAEVPNDAKDCPKCGAVFDEEDDIEVVHADGTVETTNETITCPECGSIGPATATFCIRCGAKFDGDKK